MIRLRIKEDHEYREEIKKTITDEGRIELGLFTVNLNGIRDGPHGSPELKEFRWVQDQFQVKMGDPIFSLPANLKESGYRPEEIKKMCIAAELKKASNIEWIKEKYRLWKPFWEKLKKEKESAKKKGQRK